MESFSHDTLEYGACWKSPSFQMRVNCSDEGNSNIVQIDSGDIRVCQENIPHHNHTATTSFNYDTKGTQSTHVACMKSVQLESYKEVQDSSN